MFKLIILLYLVIVGSDSAKILGVFPAPSISHQVVFRPLMLELTKRGHEVTVITTDPAFPKGQTPENLTEIDLHDISYQYWNEFLIKYGNEKDRIKFMKIGFDLISNLFEKQLRSLEVQKLLRERREFDLLFIESIIRPAHIFSYLYNAPVIELSSLSALSSTFEIVGAASHPLIYPDPMHRRIYNMTLWDKISELYIHYRTESIYMEHFHYENKMLQTVFGPNIPDLSDLRRNIQMLFLNVHPLWDFNRPVPPNVVYLGSMHQNQERELPQEWKSYLDSSKNGVIYMSFGTNVKPSMLPPEKLKIFTDVFSQLPYDVLWKWDKDELLGRSKNVRISKWLPQSDLLRHPKIKLFITQGGLQSTDEALTAGVPLIGIPIFADQWLNVEHYVKFNIGKQFSIDTLTEKELKNAIEDIINDECYRQNVIKVRTAMRDRPQSPLERAVWWTEHVLRHGGAEHLRTSATSLSWAEYYELQLVLLLLATFIITLLFSVLVIRLVISKVSSYMRLKIKIS